MDTTNNQWSNLFAGNNPEAELNFTNMDDVADITQYPNPIPDSYSSLYEELLSKCDFGNFRDNPEKANTEVFELYDKAIAKTYLFNYSGNGYKKKI